MKRILGFTPRYLLAAMLLTGTLSLQAQREGRFWTHGLGKAMKSFDQWLEKGQRSGIDTTYQDIPQLNHQVYLGTYVYWQNYQMHHPVYISDGLRDLYPDMQTWSSFNIHAHTLQAEMEVGIDWKGLAIEIPIPIRNNYLWSTGLAKNGSVWGFRIRYKNLKRMDGYSHFSGDLESMPTAPTDPTDIEEFYADKSNPHDHNVRIFYTEGYYVLWHRKFSLSAGLYGDMVQKRSAGSPLFYVNYYQSCYSGRDILIANADKYRTRQASIGAGYGYNLSLDQGKLVFHASVVPMFSVYNILKHDSYYDGHTVSLTGLTPQEIVAKYYPAGETSFYDAADNGHAHFRVNTFGRFAANYRYHRCILSLLANYRLYGYSNNKGFSILNQEADFQFNLGYCF